MPRDRSLNLRRLFDHYNQKHFGGKLRRPISLRYVKNPDPDDPGIEARTLRAPGYHETTNYRIYLASDMEGSRRIRASLLHEMVHLWGFLHNWPDAENNCERLGSRHHRRMIRILRKEPTLC